MHSIIEQYLLGFLDKQDMLTQYLSKFKSVVGSAPTPAIFKTYFTQGVQYLTNFDFHHRNILGVEEKVTFLIDDIPFVGVIDYEAEDGDGALIIGDHKTRALRCKSKRKKPTKSDIELEEYLRQLYLYSLATREKYGRYPDALEFNCFRTGDVISEQFSEHKLETTKTWIKNMVAKITDNDDWSPNMDYWKCRYLCDQNHNCEYYQMNRR